MLPVAKEDLKIEVLPANFSRIYKHNIYAIVFTVH